MNELWIRQSVKIEIPGSYYIDSHIVDNEIVETRITPQPIVSERDSNIDNPVKWFGPNA
jgi:hypothetical protein